GVAAVLVVEGQDGEFAPFCQGAEQFQHPAVEAHGQGGPGQAGADVLDDVRQKGTAGVLAFAAVGKGNFQHFSCRGIIGHGDILLGFHSTKNPAPKGRDTRGSNPFWASDGFLRQCGCFRSIIKTALAFVKCNAPAGPEPCPPARPPEPPSTRCSGVPAGPAGGPIAPFHRCPGSPAVLVSGTPLGGRPASAAAGRAAAGPRSAGL